jgi:hypothetical protein
MGHILLPNKETKIIKLVKATLRIIRRARIPLGSSKFSNKIYSNHIHLTLLVLRAKANMSYQVFMDWISNFNELWTKLGIDRIPHFTTLHKFAGRFPRRYLDMLLIVTTTETGFRVLFTSIESTGYQLTRASYYYTTVVDRHRTNGKARSIKAIKRHLKVTSVTETRKLMTLALKIRRGPDNDQKDFIPLYKKLSRSDKRPVKLAVADKGYDAEKNHQFIREELGGKSIIPARKFKRGDYRTKGKYRREMRNGYSIKTYHQRNMSETMNSTIKRTLGSEIRARNCKYQNREIYYRVICVNIG